MSLPNLSGLAHTPPCPTGKVLTVEDVRDHDDRRSFAQPDTDDQGNELVDDQGRTVLVCNLMNERFFESDDPENLVVAIELDNCGHVFHGSYLCTKVFGAKRSAAFKDGVQGIWDRRNKNFSKDVDPPRCDYCRKTFAFSNIRELMEKVEACDPKGAMGDDYPRGELDWDDLEKKYDAMLTRHAEAEAEEAGIREMQARMRIGIQVYGMSQSEAVGWANQFEDANSDDAIAAARAIQQLAEVTRGQTAAAVARAMARDFRAPQGVPAGSDLSDAAEEQFENSKAQRLLDEIGADLTRHENQQELVAAYSRAYQAVQLWAWADGNVWWNTSRREIARVFHDLRHPNSGMNREDDRSTLQLYKKDYWLSFYADSHPKCSLFQPMDPDAYEKHPEQMEWEALYANMMKTCVPPLFGAHKRYGRGASTREQLNPEFLTKYVIDLGLSTIALNRVKKANANGWHNHAAWFLPHPSCWMTAPNRASGGHVNAHCTPKLAGRLIDQERKASLSMWTWGGDPSMPEEIDLQAQFERHRTEVWNLFGTGIAPRNKDYMKHAFQIEYDHLPRPAIPDHWPRCCHMHVGVALDTAVQEHGVVYLEEVPAAAGGRCRTGYTLFQGPPLVATLSVPFSEVGSGEPIGSPQNKSTPMAMDVAYFLRNYAYNNTDSLNRIKQMYGLSEIRWGLQKEEGHQYPLREGGFETRQVQNPLLQDYHSPGEQVQVITCKLDGLRYQISNNDPTRVADALDVNPHPITVPIETYLRNGIAVLLRKPEQRGMVARAFGMGPRMQWQGGSERQPSDDSAHNRQGVLAAILANDLRERETLGEWFSPKKYKIKGVVKGRTVVMRDRRRHRVPVSDGSDQAEYDPTDPSLTESPGMVYRNRERHANLMACAEIVLENDQFFMPWHRD